MLKIWYWENNYNKINQWIDSSFFRGKFIRKYFYKWDKHKTNEDI